MSEEIEEVKDKLLFYEGGILLREHRWASYSQSAVHEKKYLDLKTKIETKLANNEPVYVQILDERRKGSVGRIKTITFTYRPRNHSGTYWQRNEAYLGIDSIEVVWDGRSNLCKPNPHEVEYLPDWDPEVGTIWAWTPNAKKEAEPRVTPYDHLGQEITPGQFVCFVHRKYGVISMKFGSVTRLTPKGGVFVKTLKLRDGDPKGEELKAFGAEDLIIVNDKLMSRLTLARLSAD